MSSLSSRSVPRLHAAVVIFAAAALTAAAPAHAASSRSTACVPRGASIVEANAQATVFAIDRDDQFTLYGCAGVGAKRRALATWFDCGCSRGDEPAPSVWLAGRVAAVNRWSCDPSAPTESCAGATRSVSLKSGRRLRAVDSPGEVEELVLRRDGAFALVRGGAVVAATSGGEEVLEPGPGYEPGSIALSVGGRRVYWTRGGVARSALLA